MESATRKNKSYATAIFIAGIAAALISVYAIGGNQVWLSYASLLLLLCLLIGLYSVTASQQKNYMSLLALSEGLEKRLSQFQSQVGRKKDMVVDAKKTIGVEEFVSKIIPQSNQEFVSQEKFTEYILAAIAKEFSIVQGLFFIKNSETETFILQGRYAYFSEELPHDFKEGEGLSGQVAKDKMVINISDIPDGYITIVSGLGTGHPKSVLIVPAIYEGITIGVLELASFQSFAPEEVDLFTKITAQLGESIVNYSTR